MTWPKSVFQWVSNLVIFWRIPDENPNSCDDAAGHLGCPFWDTHPISFLRTSRNQWKNIHSNTGCFVHRKRVHWGDDLTTLPAADATPCFWRQAQAKTAVLIPTRAPAWLTVVAKPALAWFKHGQNLRLSGLNQSHVTIFHPYPAVVKLCRTWRKSYADSGFIWYYRLIFGFKFKDASKVSTQKNRCLLLWLPIASDIIYVRKHGSPECFTILARCQRGSC